MNLTGVPIEELQAELTRRTQTCSWCEDVAIWEGWFKHRDGFGIPTGMCSLRHACGTHKKLLGNK